MSTSAILKVNDIDQHFGGLHALKHVSFELVQSEILGVIGPNGAGKSTLFNAITNLSPPVSGSILFHGKNIIGTPTHKLVSSGIAKTSQTVQIFSDMTVLDNLAVAALLHAGSITEARSIALKELEFWELDSHAKRIAGDITLAQRALLELARAMVLRPEVLLVDEVMAGLNAIEVNDILEKLVRINTARNVTLMIIEHNMRALMRISTRILALDYGAVLTIGEPEYVSNNKRVIQAYLGGS